MKTRTTNLQNNNFTTMNYHSKLKKSKMKLLAEESMSIKLPKLRVSFIQRFLVPAALRFHGWFDMLLWQRHFWYHERVQRRFNGWRYL